MNMNMKGKEIKMEKFEDMKKTKDEMNIQKMKEEEQIENYKSIIQENIDLKLKIADLENQLEGSKKRKLNENDSKEISNTKKIKNIYPKKEDIFEENEYRWTFKPIQYPKAYEFYDKMQSLKWRSQEIAYSEDLPDWRFNMKEGEKKFIGGTVGWFASADGQVLENLFMRFMKMVQVPEIRAFWAEQMSNETVHSEVYSEFVDLYYNDPEEKMKILHSITENPIVKMKSEWASKYMNEDVPIQEGFIAFLCVEGIFFSSSFCGITWLKQRNLLPSLCSANDYIVRDEGLHCNFLCFIIDLLKNRVPQETVHEIFLSAVNLEKEQAKRFLPVSLIGMNEKLMCQHIESVADLYLEKIGYDKLFNSVSPFPWMIMNSYEGKVNFFELRNTDYIDRKVKTDTPFVTDIEF